MNIIKSDDLYLYPVRCTPIVSHPLLKSVCDAPLVLLMLKFQASHSFIIHTLTLSVYTQPIFNSSFKTMLQLDKNIQFNLRQELLHTVQRRISNVLSGRTFT